MRPGARDSRARCPPRASRAAARGPGLPAPRSFVPWVDPCPSSPGPCPRPRALCLPRLPPASLYPRPFVSPPWALCPTPRAPHPISITSPQLSSLRCPFVVSLSIRSLRDLPQTRHQIALFFFFLLIFLMCSPLYSLLSAGSLITPRGFVFPTRGFLVGHPPLPSRHRVIDPLPTVCAGRAELSEPEAGTRSIWCPSARADQGEWFLWVCKARADTYFPPRRCSPPHPFLSGVRPHSPSVSQDCKVCRSLGRLSLGLWLFCWKQ